jgi:hypothetical protein
MSIPKTSSFTNTATLNVHNALLAQPNTHTHNFYTKLATNTNWFNKINPSDMGIKGRISQIFWRILSAIASFGYAAFDLACWIGRTFTHLIPCKKHPKEHFSELVSITVHPIIFITIAGGYLPISPNATQTQTTAQNTPQANSILKTPHKPVRKALVLNEFGPVPGDG